MSKEDEMLSIIRDCRDYGVAGEPLSFGLTERLQRILNQPNPERTNQMKTKVFEVRDRATFIPVLATRMCSGLDSEIDLLRRVGFSGARPASPIMVTRLAGNSIANIYPHCWGDRTMNTAHAHIEEQFDVLETGAVIDVEYLLGETLEPKKSEAKG